ncbi:MAG TPA: MmgE/PrpD family protein [Steroidobacteraceae bacterium]|nr:MmgE/PrpD family protein [Steroidobacteraceae bacterium]HRX89249.1 MmgE/PrpD family protein [Steroidobacteraceae bacterium]
MARSAPDTVTAQLVERIAAARYEQLPEKSVAAAKVFVLDSFGVALSGTRVPLVRELQGLAAAWGRGEAARIWGTGERVPTGTAAFINGYQIHNQEWDCLHEPAVVHPMAVVLSTLVAWAEAAGATRPVSGRELLLGCAVAVDVAATIGQSVRNRMQFFRPAMCGALGATAGIAAILRLDAATTRSALGSCYSQLSGTMQAHVEGSPVLPLQIGFNTRAALNSVELATRGVQGPRDWLEGPFGYFALIDPDWTAEPFRQLTLGKRIAELSHKPFPSGRATHGGADGVLTLQRAHGFAANEVSAVRVLAPPLVRQLVDRPASADMAPSYARLCLPYVAATALLTGTVVVGDFDPASIALCERQALAARIQVLPDNNRSLNALAPQRIEIDLADGARHAIDLPAVLGAPGRPLTHEQHLAKFQRAVASGAHPLPAEGAASLIAAVESLESLADVRALVDRLLFSCPTP